MIGSLFSGYGGLDIAAQEVFGLPLAFVADVEPGPCKILAHHYPDVLNLLPDGWVTDVPGLSRVEQLRALGNGVVPAQGAVALRHLLRLTSREGAYVIVQEMGS